MSIHCSCYCIHHSLVCLAHWFCIVALLVLFCLATFCCLRLNSFCLVWILLNVCCWTGGIKNNMFFEVTVEMKNWIHWHWQLMLALLTDWGWLYIDYHQKSLKVVSYCWSHFWKNDPPLIILSTPLCCFPCGRGLWFFFHIGIFIMMNNMILDRPFCPIFKSNRENRRVCVRELCEREDEEVLRRCAQCSVLVLRQFSRWAQIRYSVGGYHASLSRLRPGFESQYRKSTLL